ncbi:hypothetical protein ACS0TY_015039 [Phlomoides rotata]
MRTPQNPQNRTAIPKPRKLVVQRREKRDLWKRNLHGGNSEEVVEGLDGDDGADGGGVVEHVLFVRGEEGGGGGEQQDGKILMVM